MIVNGVPSQPSGSDVGVTVNSTIAGVAVVFSIVSATKPVPISPNAIPLTVPVTAVISQVNVLVTLFTAFILSCGS